MTNVAPVAVVRALGSPFTCGMQHGIQRASALRAFIEDGLCRLNHILPAPLSLETLRPRLRAYQRAIEAATPLLAEELRGLAVGAGIGVEEAVLLQARREILGYRRVPTMGDCTTYARTGGVAPVLGQTIDLNGDLEDQIAVLDVRYATGGGRSLLLSFGGLLGYLGLNSHGLAIGLNLVLGGAWRPGLPPYLAIRHLLDHAATVDEAIGLMHGMRLASSRSLTLCDTTKVACIEICGDRLHITEGLETTHTNHFLNPEFAAYDELNVFARNFSERRLAACRAGLRAIAGEAGPEQHFELLAAAPIRVAGDGDIRRERTVAAVVLRPDRGELHLRAGDPACAVTQCFRLEVGGAN